ncbi:MAG: hypothetical protein K5739_11125 [Lachnospiraceae bacterium]|nr:hypothetical protein [Lachnospiraceae bacterium]
MKTKSEQELQRKREEKEKLFARKYSSSSEQIENVMMGLRHLQLYFDVYWITAGHAIKPKMLKQKLMKDSFKPESTARAMVKGLVGEDYGLFYYDDEEDYLILDSFYVNEFLENLEYLLCRKISFRYHEPTDEERKEALAEDLAKEPWADDDDYYNDDESDKDN